VVGDIDTGKTAFINRWICDTFSVKYKATIGVDFKLKVQHMKDGSVCRLQCWDIAGQERFGNMTRVYYKQANAAFVIVDATRPGTLASAKIWKRDLDAEVPHRVILLITKTDFWAESQKDEVFHDSNLDAFCKEHEFHSWMLTEVKDNIGVTEAGEAMFDLCETIPLIPEKKEEKDHSSINKFVQEIFKIIIEGQVHKMEDSKIIRNLRYFYCSLYYAWDVFNDKMNSQNSSYLVIDDIHELIANDDDDSMKINRILDCMMDRGREKYKK
jgi:small GTP-binding protein